MIMDAETKITQDNTVAAQNDAVPEPPPPPPVNADARIRISKDELEAFITIIPPRYGGLNLSLIDLKLTLGKSGIIHGIDNNLLINLANNPIYDMEIPIAKGIPKRDGTNAEIIPKVEMERKLMPKEKEDGSIDFRDLGAVQEVIKGAVLCEKIAATPGIPGTTVKGTAIAPMPGRDKSMPMGKNTVLSEDHLLLFADVDGHISIAGNKINVLDVFIVNEDVSSKTGNITFIGNVVIKGNVTQGYTVRSSGDVSVSGVVESARIIAGGNLIIRGGFRGGENGELEIAGNAGCSFIEGGIVRVRGNIETSYIINSTVKCGNSIILSGRGLIRGGSVTARESITANYIGANVSSAVTVIEVGNDPDMLERFKTVSQEITAQEKNIKNVELVINSLLKLKQINRLTPDKAANLEKATLYVENMKETYLSLKEEHETLKAQMGEIGYGKLHVKNTAYHGTKIIMGSDNLTLQIDHSFCTFLRKDDGITFTSYR
jgi:hypothetical protein